MTEAQVREQLARLLAWQEAHVGFEKAVADVPPDLRGQQPMGMHSPWQLLEHLRITQKDILDFCVNPSYEEIRWPHDYWPASVAPPSAAAWNESIAAFKNDREALQKLAADTSIDLAAKIPHGNGQTYLRELVLVADHSSYHIGQLIFVRKALGNWK
jgi:hypothetical protein